MSKPALVFVGERAEDGRNNPNLHPEYRISACHSLFKSYLKVLLLILGWDLFRVYKTSGENGETRASHRALFPPELRITRDSFDKWRTSVRVPVTVLICYLVFRLMAVGLMKITDSVLLDMYIFNASRHQSLSGSSRASLDAFLSPNLIRDTMPTYYQTLIQRMMKLGNSIRE